MKATADMVVKAVAMPLCISVAAVSTASSASAEISPTPYRMPIVETTDSFAKMPVMTAAPASHVSKPWKMNSFDMPVPRAARKLSFISSVMPLKLKLPRNQIRTDIAKIIVPALIR